MPEIYRFTYEGGCGEIVEKKSRFLATVAPVASEAEALRFIEETRKKYWDARHNCTAFTIGDRQELTRCSDDGEPAGTAGRPMLEVLLGEGLHNTAVVVTRYFGGILLGTGGLVRAYSAAVKAGLSASVILERQSGVRLEIGCDYTDIGKIQYLLAQRQIPLLASEYAEKVRLEALVPLEVLDAFCADVTEQSAGRAALTKGNPCPFALRGGEAILLDDRREAL